jgi:hypothetical protein
LEQHEEGKNYDFKLHLFTMQAVKCMMAESGLIGKVGETRTNTCFHDTLFAVNSTLSYLGFHTRLHKEKLPPNCPNSGYLKDCTMDAQASFQNFTAV